MNKAYFKSSYKLSKRSRLMMFGRDLRNIVRDQIKSNGYAHVALMFMLVYSRRYSTSNYWKILASKDNQVIDVTDEIAKIFDYDAFDDFVLRTTSYGICIEDDICRRLERLFKTVYTKEVIEFDYMYRNATLN